MGGIGMKRRRLWIILAVVISLGWMAGATLLRASDLDRSAYRRANILATLCERERGEYVPPPGETLDPCWAPVRAYANDKTPFLIGGFTFGAITTLILWFVAALLFFGIRHFRGGKDQPKTGA